MGQCELRHAWLNLWDKHMTTGRINQIAIGQDSHLRQRRRRKLDKSRDGRQRPSERADPGIPGFFTSDNFHFPLHRKHGVAGKSLESNRADCVLQTRRPFRGLGQCETLIEPPILLGCVSAAASPSASRYGHVFWKLHWRDQRAEPEFYREASRGDWATHGQIGHMSPLRGSTDPSVT